MKLRLCIYIYFFFFFFIAFVSLFWSGQKNISAWVSNGHYVFDVGVHAGYLCISILTIQLVNQKKKNEYHEKGQYLVVTHFRK